jgi:hypothetical protein
MISRQHDRLVDDAFSLPVMAGLDPAIHVDPLDKPRDDE